ncbi:MAG: phosphoglycerate kinase, partial [Planctomycetes bacterium]|nr:phosphoglycerate kinase [Planctomycetota bacterium]
MSLNKKTLQSIEPAGKRVFVRVDFNVPLTDLSPDGQRAVSDDTRIQAALPTLRFLLEAGAAVIVASHLGRPKGEVKEELRMSPVAAHLATLLNGFVVHAADDTIGPDAQAKVSALKPGELLLLENLRFDAGEKSGDSAFSA